MRFSFWPILIILIITVTKAANLMTANFYTTKSVVKNELLLREYSIGYSKVRIISDDKNEDGVPDHWGYYEDEKLRKTLDDTNCDGLVDVWGHLNENQEVIRLEFDKDFNGTIDDVIYAPDGWLETMLLDMDYDGVLETKITYDKDRKILKEEKVNIATPKPEWMVAR